MTGQQAGPHVIATAAARQAIADLTARRGPVIFVQSAMTRTGADCPGDEPAVSEW